MADQNWWQNCHRVEKRLRVFHGRRQSFIRNELANERRSRVEIVETSMNIVRQATLPSPRPFLARYNGGNDRDFQKIRWAERSKFRLRSQRRPMKLTSLNKAYETYISEVSKAGQNVFIWVWHAPRLRRDITKRRPYEGGCQGTTNRRSSTKRKTETLAKRQSRSQAKK